MSTSVLAKWPRRPRPEDIRIFLAALFLASTAACGLKGDLYLPDQEEPETTASSVAEEDPETNEDEDEQDS